MIVCVCVCVVYVTAEKKNEGAVVTIGGGIEGWCFQVRQGPCLELRATEILAEKKSYRRTRPVPSSPQIPQ